MAEESTTLGRLAGRGRAVLGLAGMAALAGSLALGWSRGDGLRYFLHSYLLNYAYVLSIALGALCFVALQHACRAGWSVSVRRLSELLAAPMPLLAVLALPILVPALLGKGALYCWADPSAAAGDELLATRRPISTRFSSPPERLAASWSGGCWPAISSCNRPGRTTRATPA